MLVANRGEIARRVFRTCGRLGLGTVAVFSDADADAPYVAEADVAVRLPGSAADQTYLRADLIVAAAHRAGADAVHPGYGFLSENAEFARAVLAAGMAWIGPPPEAIEAMGSKIRAKEMMAAAGVPVLPQLDPATVTAADLPVLIKASAGGGGRGMRVVHALDDLGRELDLARAEAAAAFGDPTVFCEPYLVEGRHIEVQIMADEYGTVWAVGERECSIQRRHQKVVEEAPSPLVERVDGMRERLYAAARSAAGAVGYAGAGTVEFLAAGAARSAGPGSVGPDAAEPSGRFYFLEMNTRLQVEHPVTECTTGLDLVALQVHVAEGGRLDPEPPTRQGHAIEVRLYAEDPATEWRPQAGRLQRFHVPDVTVEFAPDPRPAGIRLDAGVVDGSTVTVHYDPMLAKVISWAPTRRQAAQALSTALTRTIVQGVATNRDLLVNVLRHRAFLAGETDTAFFARHGIDHLAAPLVHPAAERIAAVVAALALDAATRMAAPVLRGLPSGWRNVVSQPQRIELDGPAGRHLVAYRFTRDGVHVLDQNVRLLRATPDSVALEVDGCTRRFSVSRYGGEIYVGSAIGTVRFTLVERFADPADHVAAGSLLAPMPGTVARIAAAEGDTVRSGQPILWLEAMKMQHEVTAPVDGTITELPVRVGQPVDVGVVLAVVTPTEENA